jgi:hypothetical protein
LKVDINLTLSVHFCESNLDSVGIQIYLATSSNSIGANQLIGVLIIGTMHLKTDAIQFSSNLFDRQIWRASSAYFVTCFVGLRRLQLLTTFVRQTDVQRKITRWQHSLSSPIGTKHAQIESFQRYAAGQDYSTNAQLFNYRTLNSNLNCLFQEKNIKLFYDKHRRKV